MARQRAHLRVPGDFGLALQQARLASGLSQEQLAQRVGVPQSTISQVEAGQTTIYLRRLLALANATGLEFTAEWEDPDAAGG